MNTELKKDIVEVGKLLYDKGLLVGTDGNMSVRVSEREILITASGFCKGRLTAQHITTVDIDGNVLDGLKPARDIRMHLAAYRARPLAKAVVHAHPPIITGYAMSDVSFERTALPEVFFALKGIGVSAYATPTTFEVPMEVTRVLTENKICQAMLLANHGALTLGDDIFDAFYKMEVLEMYAKANLVSKILVKTNFLSSDQMEKVVRIAEGEDPDSVVR